MADHDHPSMQFWEIEHPLLTSVGTKHACGTHICIHMAHIHTGKFYTLEGKNPKIFKNCNSHIFIFSYDLLSKESAYKIVSNNIFHFFTYELLQTGIQRSSLPISF